MSKSKSYVRFPDGETHENNPALWRSAIAEGRCEVLKGAKGWEAREQFLRKQLAALGVVPGVTLKIICTYYRAYPGTSRFVVLLPISTDSGLMVQDITRQVGELCGMRVHKDGEIVMGGCGYSKSFQIVYDLGRAMFPDGFGVEGTGPHGHKCRPATKEKALEAVAAGYTFRGRNGDKSGWDTDGGYALGHN